MSSPLKWSLFLALTALLSSQSCSANRAHIFSDPWHMWPDQPTPAGGPYRPTPGDGSDPSPAQGLSPVVGPYQPLPVDGPDPSPSEGPGARPTPVSPTDAFEPSPARRVPSSPKAEITAGPVPAMKNGSNESDVSRNCGSWPGGPGCGGPGVGCGGPPCMPPPQKNPYYCQPARCSAYPGCGAGGGFTIYVDDNFMAAVSSSGNEKKP